MKVRDIMQRNVITAREEDELAYALQVMIANAIRHLPVVEEGRVVGVLSEHDVLIQQRETGHPYTVQGRVGEAMSTPEHHVAPQAELADAAALMAVEKIGCLPVIDAGRLVGIITTTDVLAANAQYPVEPGRAPEARVEEIMTRNLAACYADDPVYEAVAFMTQAGTRHLPVVDGNMRVVGMLSDRDVRSAVGDPLAQQGTEASRERRLQALRVSHIMTPEPRTLSIGMSLKEAVRALVDDRFGALPVVDAEDRLVGMLSYIDVLRRLA